MKVLKLPPSDAESCGHGERGRAVVLEIDHVVSLLPLAGLGDEVPAAAAPGDNDGTPAKAVPVASGLKTAATTSSAAPAMARRKLSLKMRSPFSQVGR